MGRGSVRFRGASVAPRPLQSDFSDKDLNNSTMHSTIRFGQSVSDLTTWNGAVERRLLERKWRARRRRIRREAEVEQPPHSTPGVTQHVVSKDSVPRPRRQACVPVFQTHVQRARARGGHRDVANVVFAGEEAVAVVKETACRHADARSTACPRSKRNGHVAVESRGVIVDPSNARTTGSDILPAHADGGLALSEPAGFPAGTEAERLLKRFV